MSGPVPLTERQEHLWRFIASSDRVPSFSEMADALGLKSKSGVHRCIEALEERGFIRRIRNRARAIELVDEPRLNGLAAYTNTALIAEIERRLGL